MGEGRHSRQTVADGIHIVQAFEYADQTARDGAAGLTTADVGKAARQTDDDTFWLLTDDSPVTWVGPLGSFSDIILTAGENLAAGDVLTVDSSGEAVKASSSFSGGLFEVVGVARAAALATAAVSMARIGDHEGVLFGVAPAGASNGSFIFLSSTAGQATLTPPASSGNVIFLVGVLQGADGADTTPDVLFRPQYISRVP